MITYFDIWVSVKYILPKTREKFFSLITVFSFLGISLGVATLIIVMSVMNGFRDELTKKILNINGHLKIQSFVNSNDSKDIKELIEKEIENTTVHSVLTSQGLVSANNYTSGVLLKGVNYSFFEKRKFYRMILRMGKLIYLKTMKVLLLGKN